MISLAESWRTHPDLALRPLTEGVRRAASAIRVVSDRPKPLVQYQRDPVGFFVDVLGIPEHTIRWSLNPGYKRHQWDSSHPDPLAAILEALAAGKNVGVESGTGTGKSFLLAGTYLWFLGSFDGARVFTFAPKADQLRLFSWAELRKFWPKFKRHFPAADLLDLEIRMIEGSKEWGAWGYPVAVRAGEDVASRAAGMHAEHMLLAYEEMQGDPPSVIEAGEQTCTSPHNLRIGVGNPDHQFDPLHQFCEKPYVEAVRISALDHPNVVTGDASIVPGATSRQSVDRRRDEKNGGEQGRMFQSRVRGISPTEAADALIRREWVERAFDRWRDKTERARYRQGLPARGVDVANSEDGDLAAIARGTGACLDEIDAFPCPDASILGVRVAAEMALKGIDVRHVGVDSVGVGASTVNKLKELGLYIRALNGGEKATPVLDEDLVREKGKGVVQEEVFYNLRAQMHWQMRLDLQHDLLALRPDPELLQDLLTPTWETKRGMVLVEAKEEISERLPNKRSPNKGDAAVYWNWVRFRRALKEPEKVVSAWDPDVLEHEGRESRRVRTPKPIRDRRMDPTNLERIP